MRVASLILDIPTQSIDSLFYYEVPDDMADAAVGCAASVPFGGRPAIGYIVNIEVLEPSELESRGLKAGKLKPIASIASKPYFDEDGAACALHLANSCIAPLSTCIRLFTPPGGVPRVVRDGHGWRIEQPEVAEVDDRYVSLTDAGRDYVPRKGASRQQAIIDALRAGELRVTELRVEFGSVSQALNTLERRGLVTIEHRRRTRGHTPSETDTRWSYGQVALGEQALTQGQAHALAAIEQARANPDGGVVLLDGVTGSGKTEVYLRAI